MKKKKLLKKVNPLSINASHFLSTHNTVIAALKEKRNLVKIPHFLASNLVL